MIKDIGQLGKKIIWKIFPYLGFLIMASGLMVCLLYAVYSIPVEKIKENAVKSADIMLKTSDSVHPIHSVIFPGARYDITTDARMLNMASILPTAKIIQDSLLNPRINYTNSPRYNLYMMLHDNTLTTDTIQTISRTLTNFSYPQYFRKIRIEYYPRFWHGYLIFLKPLLSFFDLGQIRWILLGVQLFLLIWILYLMYKRLGFKYCVAFLTAVCFFNPYSSWMCLEFATDINIMLLAMLWILLRKKIDDRYMFFVIGAITILFDFLTFPLITLGIPLITYVCLYDRSFKDNVLCVIKNSLLWSCGYALMWFSKWGIATIFTPYNVILDGWQNVLHRTSGTMENNVRAIYSLGSTIYSCVSSFWVTGALFYVAFFILALLINYVFVPYQFKFNKRFFIICGIGCMPFVWSVILLQHTFVHARLFTAKIFVITIYAILAAIVCCLQSKHIVRINDEKAK